MCFCITDLDAVISSPTGLPAAQIFLDTAGKTGGTIMWIFVILTQLFTGCSAMLADTRMAYAFARDGALPFSRYIACYLITSLYFADPIIRFWSKVNERTRTPVNAVWLVVFISSALTLVAIGSTLHS